jgi:O-antigen ligase
LFVLGLVAGRGIGSPRLALRVGLLVCVVDAIVSLYLMDEFGPGMRSTFNYFKITAGLPLVGLYLAAVLRETSAPGERRHWMVHAAIVLLLVVGIVLSVSRGMLLGWLLGLAIATYVRKPSQALLGVTAVLVGMLLWSSAFAEVGVEYLRLGQEETITGRFREVEAAWDGFVAAPMFGEGLGALVEVDGFRKAFVHNMAAYHLWKFGLVGCVLLLLPLFAIGRELRRSPRRLRALAIGAAAGIIGYLVTCAAYKTYYLVWIYGVVIGTSLTYFGELARAKAAREREAAPPERASA